jgi:hypothetical protein
MHARPDHSYQTSGWSYLNCDSCLKETRVRTGYHIVRTVDWSSLSWNLERNQKLIECWEGSGCYAETSGRIQAGIETSRYSMGSGWNLDFVRTDDAGLSSVRTVWHVVRTDGTVDRWASGRDGLIIRTADRELWISSDLQTLNSGIPVYNIFTLKWFCPNTEWDQNTNKLPLCPFWDTNHLTGLEIHSRSKNKNYSPFLSQRDIG